MRRIHHERRAYWLALLGGAPAVAALIAVLVTGEYSAKVQWTVGVIAAGFWLACASAVRERIASPLRTLANLLEALREGDYSIRARNVSPDDALGEVMQQVNAMSATLRAQRLGAMEATTLLRKVMEEIDVAVFAFDGERRLKLVNRAAERLLGQTSERMLGAEASTLGIADLLDTPASTIQRQFAGSGSRWGIARSVFREEGRPHLLLVVTDMTRALREEELQAWQRIVRVLGHELNNSLTPIKSIAGSLGQLLRRHPLPDDWHQDTTRGLDIITGRSESLNRFMAAYANLAKLPRPNPETVELGALLRHAIHLEPRLRIGIQDGPEIHLKADRAQLEQLLINILRNAVDAALTTAGGVTAGWRRVANSAEIWVADSGPGLSNTNNLFVPFFTTKPGGSGIGLVLSRQIAEAHGGVLVLSNRTDRPGCIARLTLPL